MIVLHWKIRVRRITHIVELNLEYTAGEDFSSEGLDIIRSPNLMMSDEYYPQ
jgi:hypothetical protein